MNKTLKFFLEFGPLIIFFLLSKLDESIFIAGYELQPIFAATASLIITTVISLAIMYIMLRKIPMVPLVSGIMLVLLGGTTIYLNDVFYLQIKITVVNILFGTILLIGLYFNKLFLKFLLEEGFKLSDEGWTGLTIRWGMFFFFLAILNEIIWRNFSIDTWTNFKVFGILGITMVFVLFQTRFLIKHMIDEKASTSDSKTQNTHHK